MTRHIVPALLFIACAVLWVAPPLLLAWYLEVGPLWAVVYLLCWWIVLALEARRLARRHGAWKEVSP